MVIRRPHFVPRTYLRAWADPDATLAYRRRGANVIPNGVRNVAVAGGIYGLGQLGDANERLYQQIEEEWPSLRSDLLAQGDLQGNRRSLFAVYTALQLMRTLKRSEEMNFISSVAATTAVRPIPRDAVRAYLRDLDDVEPGDNEVVAAWSYVNGAPAGSTPELSHSVAVDVAVTAIAPRLETMNWTVHKFRGPVLISSDAPVHLWKRPTPEPRRGGMGIETADEIRFPLSPGALLVMDRGPRQPTPQQSSLDPRAINVEIGRQCHQFIFGTPSSRAFIGNLLLSDRAPRLRFRMLGPDGEELDSGDMLHMYVD
jgi:hypothetical protein